MGKGVVGKAAVLAAASALGAAAFVVGRRLWGRMQRDEHSYPSMFGEAEVFTMQTDDGTPVRVLYVGGGFQSASYLGRRRMEPVFEYYRGFDHMFDPGIPVNRVLMLGGGGFSYPKHLLSSRPGGPSIDVVEIDPAIVQIARKHFFVDELERKHGAGGSRRLRCFEQDGLEYLRQAPPGFYDVVINDSFGGADPTVALLTRAALEEAKRCMVPGGLYLLNAVVPEVGPGLLNTFMELLLEAFENAYAISCYDEEFAGEENWLVVGTDGSYAFEDVERWLSR
ncbi:MAG: spermidine synthase [Coriobacteriales bacterium]